MTTTVSATAKPYIVQNAQELITLSASGQFEDTLYIGNKRYWSDFSFKTKEEAVSLLHTTKKTPHNTLEGELFVCNERTGETVPFQKNHYLIHDRGYFTFDGEQYISCDDNGNEIQKFSYK